MKFKWIGHVQIWEESEGRRGVITQRKFEVLYQKNGKGCQDGENNEYSLLWERGSLPPSEETTALRTHMPNFVSYLKKDPTFSRLTLTEPRSLM